MKDERGKMVTEEKGNEQKLLEKESVDVLAKELVEFAKKEFPEAADRFSMSDALLELFWQKKGIEDRYGLPPKMRLKLERVEAKAEKIIEELEESSFRVPEWFKKESVDHIVSEILKLANENNIADYISRGYSSPWLFIERYWASRGFNRVILYNDLALKEKLGEIELLAREGLEKKMEAIRIRKEKEFIEKMVPAIEEWLEDRCEAKVTRAHIDLYLLEKGMTIPRFRRGSNLKDVLYLAVKTGYR